MIVTCKGKEIELVKISKPIAPPTKCISCNSDLFKDGAHIFCRNDECDGKALRLIKTWLTKRNILHLGDELLIELYEKHNVKEPQDLYSLTEDYLAKCSRGAGIVGGNAKRIMAELEKSKQCPLNEFVGSLGVKFLGRRQAEIMINQGVDTLEKFVTATVDQLKDLEGFSDSKALQMVEGIKKARYRIKALLGVGIVVSEDKPEVKLKSTGTGPLVGKCFCFTGAIEKIDGEGNRFTRQRMWDVVRENGGEVNEDVKAGVTHLVQVDPSKESSKTKKAKKAGIEIISEADFWRLLDD